MLSYVRPPRPLTWATQQNTARTQKSGDPQAPCGLPELLPFLNILSAIELSVILPSPSPSPRMIAVSPEDYWIRQSVTALSVRATVGRVEIVMDALGLANWTSGG